MNALKSASYSEPPLEPPVPIRSQRCRAFTLTLTSEPVVAQTPAAAQVDQVRGRAEQEVPGTAHSLGEALRVETP